MSDNVLQFPSRLVRDRAALEEALRSRLRADGYLPEAENRVLTSMGEFIELLVSFDFDFSVAGADSESVMTTKEALAAALHAYSLQLIVERLEREKKIIAGQSA